MYLLSYLTQVEPAICIFSLHLSLTISLSSTHVLPYLFIITSIHLFFGLLLLRFFSTLISPIFLAISSLYLLYTRSNYFNLFFLLFRVMHDIPKLFLKYLFLILFNLITPYVRLIIIISAAFLLTSQHSNPYIKIRDILKTSNFEMLMVTSTLLVFNC